jgi:hypothetical protein
MSAAQDNVHTTLQRVGARAWGVATGLMLGGALFIATVVLVLKGGVDKGAHLGRLSQVLPGYDVTVGGAFIGFMYAFVVGYALGRVLAPRRVVSISSATKSQGKHVRLNGASWGLAIGLVLALMLFASTNALALRGGEHAGDLMQRLNIYLPGYSVSFAGSLIGAAYVFAIGWLFGRLIGVVYNRAVEVAER